MNHRGAENTEKRAYRGIFDQNFLPTLKRLKPLRNGNYELRITNYELRITNYELRITNYELRITNYELR
ncbi:MAG: hypothetical protein V7L19_18210, partial [Nostoc sp.]